MGRYLYLYFMRYRHDFKYTCAKRMPPGFTLRQIERRAADGLGVCWRTRWQNTTSKERSRYGISKMEAWETTSRGSSSTATARSTAVLRSNEWTSANGKSSRISVSSPPPIP